MDSVAVLIQCDCRLSQKRRLGHSQGPCEGTVRTRPSAGQGERPQRKPTLPTPWSRSSNPQNYEKVNFCHLSHFFWPWLWHPYYHDSHLKRYSDSEGMPSDVQAKVCGAWQASWQRACHRMSTQRCAAHGRYPGRGHAIGCLGKGALRTAGILAKPRETLRLASLWTRLLLLPLSVAPRLVDRLGAPSMLTRFLYYWWLL